MRAGLLAAGLAAAAVGLVAAGRGAGRPAILGRPVRLEVGDARGARLRRRRRSSWLPAAAAVLGSILGWAGLGPVGAVAGGCLGGAVPFGVWRRRATTRTAALETQLADAIGTIASGVRSGRSTMQALAATAQRTPEPLAGSLRAVVEDVGLGSSLDDALDRWVSAIPVPDVRLVAAVLRMQRGTGSGFPVVLDGLARTLRERRAAIREVRSLTAQARLSGAILGLLPVVFFLFLWITSRRDMSAALGTSVGRAAIVAGIALQAVAFLWIRRLLRVEA